MCEAASALTFGGAEDNALFTLTVQALSNVCNHGESQALIKFLLSALSVSGYTVGLDNCTECGSPLVSEDKMRFDMNSGSFTCWDCGTGAGVSGVTYNVLRLCAGKTYTPSYITPDGEKRALKLLREYLTFKTDSKCKSLTEYIQLL